VNIVKGENLGSSVARLVLLAAQLQKDSADGRDPETVYHLANLMKLEIDQVRELSLGQMQK
jgi:hypothetical protein